MGSESSKESEKIKKSKEYQEIEEKKLEWKTNQNPTRNIVLFGAMRVGKSSFVNSVYHTFFWKKEYTPLAPSYSNGSFERGTVNIKRYDFEGLNFRLIDTPGIEAKMLHKPEELGNHIKGILGGAESIDIKTGEMKLNSAYKASAVLLFLPAELVDNETKAITKHINSFVKEAGFDPVYVVTMASKLSAAPDARSTQLDNLILAIDGSTNMYYAIDNYHEGQGALLWWKDTVVATRKIIAQALQQKSYWKELRLC